jgi:cyclophilin family peptidyl-prolyl cis-trans isomerase
MHARSHTLLGRLRGTSVREAVALRGGHAALGALLLAVVTAGCGANSGVDTDGAADGDAGDTEAADTTDGEGTADRADRYDEAPEQTIDVDADYGVTVETSLGTIEADLFAGEAPVTVNSFVFLAREGYFDGLIFHRVIPEFVAQGGDPRGDGTGGPGYAFEDELEVAEREGYDLGTLAMANSGPNTNGSQFFFTVDDVDLPPLYSVFGQVTSGLEVLEAIAAQPTGPGDRPVEDIRIVTVEIDGP